MHGNVNEICSDRYSNKLPGDTDPKVQLKSENYVMRGGSWSSTAEYCQSGFRNKARGKSSSGEPAHVGL
jgi:formylglycine-generating enzyme required for sulfatase activity